MKTKEVLVEEAIHRANAREARRKLLCLQDDLELETQMYSPSFHGTHPQIDMHTAKRRKWLKGLQRGLLHDRVYRIVLRGIVIYFVLHLWLLALRIIFKI